MRPQVLRPGVRIPTCFATGVFYPQSQEVIGGMEAPTVRRILQFFQNNAF